MRLPSLLARLVKPRLVLLFVFALSGAAGIFTSSSLGRSSLIWSAPGGPAERLTLNPPTSPVPGEYFGLHIHRAFSTTPWPPVPFGSWRLWDAKVHWPQVETEKNRYDWRILDREVDLAEKHHVDLLMTFGFTPDWATGAPVDPAMGRFHAGRRAR